MIRLPRKKPWRLGAPLSSLVTPGVIANPPRTRAFNAALDDDLDAYLARLAAETEKALNDLRADGAAPQAVAALEARLAQLEAGRAAQTQRDADQDAAIAALLGAPPSVSVASPAAGATVTGTALTVTGAAAAAPPRTLSGLRYRSRQGAGAWGAWVALTPSSAWSFTLTGLAPGAYTVEVEATDSVGAAFSASRSATVQAPGSVGPSARDLANPAWSGSARVSGAGDAHALGGDGQLQVVEFDPANAAAYAFQWLERSGVLAEDGVAAGDRVKLRFVGKRAASAPAATLNVGLRVGGGYVAGSEFTNVVLGAGATLYESAEFDLPSPAPDAKIVLHSISAGEAFQVDDVRLVKVASGAGGVTPPAPGASFPNWQALSTGAGKTRLFPDPVAYPNVGPGNHPLDAQPLGALQDVPPWYPYNQGGGYQLVEAGVGGRAAKCVASVLPRPASSGLVRAQSMARDRTGNVVRGAFTSGGNRLKHNWVFSLYIPADYLPWDGSEESNVDPHSPNPNQNSHMTYLRADGKLYWLRTWSADPAYNGLPFFNNPGDAPPAGAGREDLLIGAVADLRGRWLDFLLEIVPSSYAGVGLTRLSYIAADGGLTQIFGVVGPNNYRINENANVATNFQIGLYKWSFSSASPVAERRLWYHPGAVWQELA